MPYQFNMILSEIFENICHSEHSRGSKHLGTMVQGAPTPLGRAPCLVGPWCPPPLIPAPMLFFFLPKNHYLAQARVLAHFAAIFDLLAQSTPHKTALGIVPWYVTPPMVQLVFVLVLYSLQYFAAKVTMFLSLHVKFIWSQVVLMLDIGSRHL